MKIISIFIFLIFGNTLIKAQSDSLKISRFDRKMSEIEYEYNRPFRQELDSEDFLLIKGIKRMQGNIHLRESVAVDSAIAILTHPKTPYILADTLAALILNNPSYYGVSQLLDNIQVSKMFLGEKRFPVYNALQGHADIGLVYLHVLFSDYLDDYIVQKEIYGDSVNLLIALFNGNYWSKNFINEALDTCKNEHKRKILIQLLDSMNY